MAIYGVGGSGPNIQEHGNSCYAQDIYRLHLSGLTDYAGAYRIEAVERGVINPITPDIRGVRFVPHARRAFIHLFLRIRCCIRTTIALAPTVPRADLQLLMDPIAWAAPPRFSPPDDAGD
jgi:hypothetical protein